MVDEPSSAPLGAEDLVAVLAETVVPSAITAIDGRYLWVNQSMCKLTERDEATLLSSRWTDITVPDDREVEAEEVRNLIAGTADSYRMRKRYLLPSGTMCWGDVTVTAIRHEEGQPLHLLRQVIDITEVVVLEQAREDSLRVLRSAIDAQISPELVLTAVRDANGGLVDLRVIEANAAAIRRLGRPREQLIDQGMLALFGATADKVLWSKLTHVIDSGDPLDLPVFRTSNIVVNQERVFELRATKVDDGLALCWRDITETYRQTDEELRRTNEQYRLVIDNAADVIFHSVAGIAQWMSPSALDVLGVTPEEIIGRPTVDYWHPDDRSAAAAMRDATLAGAPGHATLRWRHRQGHYLWLEVVTRPVTEPDGAPGMVGSMRDVTAQIQAQQELAVSEQRYRILAENVADVVGTGSVDGRITWVSESVHDLLGWAPTELVGKDFADFIHPDDRTAVEEARREFTLGKASAYDARMRTADGDWRWIRVRARPVLDHNGAPSGVVAGWQDIHDRVQAIRRLDEILGTDSLTGLPNRATMERRIDARQAQARATGGVCAAALLCIAIDRLGDVNSAVNHAAGDLVLTTIARRIAELAPDAQFVGRGSGADFLVLLADLTTTSDAVAFAERIRTVVKQEVVVDHRRVRVSASIGITSCHLDTPAAELVRSATLAMKAAKSYGRDRLAFDDPSLRVEAERIMTLAEHARDGIAADRFQAWYMPIVDLASRAPVGYEALVRWDLADGTVMEPHEFMTALIEARLIGDVDRIILRQAIARLRTLPEPVFMSVNVSPQALGVPGYSQEVLALIHEAGVAPGRLHLELTETSLFAASAPIIAEMRTLADAGVRWYVDDFGTGYSSLSHLHELPLAGLKLDISFTRALASGDHRALRLTQALAGLSLGLDLDTIAEGVEDETQASILWGQGWLRGQGWLFGRPAPSIPTVAQ